MSEQNPYQPATIPQGLALDCEADLLLFGGSAGSLKSHTILLDAMQECAPKRKDGDPEPNRNFRGIIFRQSFPQLTEVIEKTNRLYRPLGAEYNEQKKTWTWPCGAKLRLGYMQADKDVYEYWGEEYSFIAFDESTMHTEYQIRTILSRLRSTDARLKRRMRLATNPGGPGASFQQQIFLRGACPIHEPEKAAIPGKLYTDRVWPSDGKRIPFSVAFIPGKLSEHNLLGPEYVEQLRMQQGALADQLAEGCWCELSGSYFGNIWNKEKHIVPIASIDQRYWYQHWISLDYGIGKSWAAGGLYMMPPRERNRQTDKKYKLGEICVPNTSVGDFAKQVADAFIIPTVDGHRRNISVVYADPANFTPNYDVRAGGGHAVCDQINEVLREYELKCTPASNDRIGGAQLLWRELQADTFMVADTCPMSAESIRTRVHDEKKPGDILKIKGDPLDDTYDETRYALYSFINEPEKPREVRIAEAVQPYFDAGDMTNVHLAAEKIRRKIDEEDDPFQGSNARQQLRRMGMRRSN